MSKYAVIIENAGPNLCAYVPDLPGCLSAGYTLEEVAANIHEAIALHIELMLAQGEEIPHPTSQVVLVEVAPSGASQSQPHGVPERSLAPRRGLSAIRS
jgi:predicted RNase H-like HicB family nuclease